MEHFYHELHESHEWGQASRVTTYALIQLPRNSRSQAKVGKVVTIDNLKPGDLLFFALRGNTVNHVGIYVGGHNFVHAPKKYVPVSKNSLNNSFWRRALKVARRLG